MFCAGNIQTSNDYSDYSVGVSNEEEYYEPNDGTQQSLNIDTSAQLEKMVEVIWNGSAYFVPETLTYLGE